MKTIGKKFIASDIKLLQSLNDKETRNILLESPTPELVKFIRNICWNLVNGNINVSETDKRKLSKFKDIIRILGNTKRKKVKKFINQSGGFVGVLTPILIAIASQLGGKLFSKAIGI